MAWNYVPPGEYTAGYWVDNSTPGYPLISYTDPTQGFDNRNAALESLYIPTAGNRMDQVQSLIAQKPEEYAKYGITPQNAADTVNSTFYDRINNIDNDPLNFLNSLAFLPHGMGLANLFTGGGVDSFLNNTFGSPTSVNVSSGGMPTQVGGWYGEAPTFSGTFDPTLPGTPPMPAPGMPPAIPETTQQLTEWGLKEVSPGVWSQPAFPDIQMGAGDWLKYGSSLLGNSLGGAAASAASGLLGSGAPGASGGLFGGSMWDTLGKLLPAGLGMYASNQQANKLSELAQKYQDFGAPYRQQLADISANPDNFYNSLGAQKATDAVLNKLSIGGNPAGSANKQALTIDSLYDQYGKERDRLAGFGGLTNYNQAAPNLEAQAIGANANMWNAAGAGLNDIFNPKTSLADLLKQGKIV